MLNDPKTALSKINGSSEHKALHGEVFFRQTPHGVLITAAIHGLPMQEENNKFGVFGFHIHEGTECDKSGDFSKTLGHFNPSNTLHPYHSGDLPPLFSNNGNAYMQILIDRFRLKDIIGRTVVIHSSPDDFKTQPSGNSGKKIACGVIKEIKE